MGLLERVGRLIRANIRDLTDKAENPEKLLKQLLLDMENQHMQLKTQVAIAMADLHVLEKKKVESAAAQAEWVRKAQLALGKNNEKTARTALARSLPHEKAVQNFSQQIADQSHQVETLKSTLAQLQAKVAQTRSAAEVLMTRHRRSRTSLGVAQAGLGSHSKLLEAERQEYEAPATLQNNDAARFEALERADRVEQLLATLRAKDTQ